VGMFLSQGLKTQKLKFGISGVRSAYRHLENTVDA
jgi:hypothetical protein